MYAEVVWTCKKDGNERMAKKVYASGVEGIRGRGRSTRVWMDGAKEALNNRGWIVELAKEIVHDRPELRGLVNGT